MRRRPGGVCARRSRRTPRRALGRRVREPSASSPPSAFGASRARHRGRRTGLAAGCRAQCRHCLRWPLSLSWFVCLISCLLARSYVRSFARVVCLFARFLAYLFVCLLVRLSVCVVWFSLVLVWFEVMLFSLVWFGLVSFSWLVCLLVCLLAGFCEVSPLCLCESGALPKAVWHLFAHETSPAPLRFEVFMVAKHPIPLASTRSSGSNGDDR